jgi:cupin superfamily acireductone dioxygenase involved in methionine salvage
LWFGQVVSVLVFLSLQTQKKEKKKMHVIPHCFYTLCFATNLYFFRSKKQYVIDQGEDFDPQSFYIEFGFKTRDFAEEELKRAVNAAYRETNDELVKSYLHGEFLHNDFQVIFFLTRKKIFSISAKI